MPTGSGACTLVRMWGLSDPGAGRGGSGSARPSWHSRPPRSWRTTSAARPSRRAPPRSPEPVRNATVVIEEGGARKGFTTTAVSGVRRRHHRDRGQPRHDGPHVHLRGQGPDGLPLFDLRIRCRHLRDRPGRRAAGRGRLGFYCKFHPSMRGVLTVGGTGGGVEPERPSFDQPLVVPPTKRGADIRLVMVRAGPHDAGRPAHVDVDLQRHLPRPDDPAARRPQDPGHDRQPPAEGSRVRRPRTSTATTTRRRTTASPPPSWSAAAPAAPTTTR